MNRFDACGYIAIGINILAIIIFFILIFAYKKKSDAIKHYENLRDQLTVRKKKEKNVTGELSNLLYHIPIVSIIGIFIVTLVGINLLTIGSQGIASTPLINQTITANPATSTVLGLTTIFFALGIMSSGVGLAVGGLRRGGLI